MTSSTAGHTAGPWQWDAGVVPPDGPERYADIYADDGETIIASFNDCISEGRANARLIVSAPDLLALLEELIDIEGPCPGTAEWASKVHAAIAKSKGGA